MWSTWLCVLPSEIQVYLWTSWHGNIIPFTDIWCGKVCYSDPITITNSCELLFLIVGLKYHLSLFLHWNLLTKLSYGTLGIDRINALVPCTGVFILSLILSWCMHIQNDNITLMTSQYCIWHLVTNKFYPCNWCYGSYMNYKPLPRWWLVFL
jgi:hypothetical protein